MAKAKTSRGKSTLYPKIGEKKIGATSVSGYSTTSLFTLDSLPKQKTTLKPIPLDENLRLKQIIDQAPGQVTMGQTALHHLSHDRKSKLAKSTRDLVNNLGILMTDESEKTPSIMNQNDQLAGPADTQNDTHPLSQTDSNSLEDNQEVIKVTSDSTAVARQSLPPSPPELSDMMVYEDGEDYDLASAIARGAETGFELRKLRLANGQLLAEVAQATHISESTLLHLENGDYQTLPEKAYIIGYIRAYARHFKTDPDPYISLFNQENDSSKSIAMPNHRFLHPIQTALGPRWLVIFLSLLLILILYIAWLKLWPNVSPFYEKANGLPIDTSSQTSADDQKESANSTPESANSQTPAKSEIPPSTPVLQPEPASSPAPVLNQSEGAIAEKSASPVKKTEAPVSQAWVLRTKAEVWIIIKDQKNRVRYEGKLLPDDQLPIENGWKLNSSQDKLLYYQGPNDRKLAVTGGDGSLNKTIVIQVPIETQNNTNRSTLR